MWLGVSIYAAYVATIFAGTTFATSLPLSVHSSNTTTTSDDHHGPNTSRIMRKKGRKRSKQTQLEVEVHGKRVDEGDLIAPINIPFKQRKRDWGIPGKGISMDSTGEPKSGTTWTGRIITELAIHLCGSATNKWCKMGGLKVISKIPAPSYVWEMLHADTGELFLHFDGRKKHPLPGFNSIDKNGCMGKAIAHADGFADHFPCVERGDSPSRQQLLDCLPLTTSSCTPYMPSRYPDVRRMPVVFRDPRDVVISSHRYRLVTVHHPVEPNLEDFIRHYFEIIVAWQHQRWVWHTTFYKEASHVMFYEDLKTDYVHLIDLAAFMGLECTREQAWEVWKQHLESTPHPGYQSYGLSAEMITYMNATMSTLLPEAMLVRYGLPLSSGG